jgi:hypothetical protein
LYQAAGIHRKAQDAAHFAGPDRNRLPVQAGQGHQGRRRLGLRGHQGNIMTLEQKFPGQGQQGVFGAAEGAEPLADEG